MRHEPPPHQSLPELLERDPGRFEATTAFRVAQNASETLTSEAPVGSAPVVLPVSGFSPDGSRAVVRSAFAALVGPLGALPPGVRSAPRGRWSTRAG
jgi:type VI secretion system protein ImpH